MSPLRILTWSIDSRYLYSLTQTGNIFYLPTREGGPEGYAGRQGGYPWSENVREVKEEDVREIPLDCVLFQSRKNYLQDQFETLSEEQWQLPAIYLEHGLPENPANPRHTVDDPDVFLVHVSPYHELVWDCGSTPTRAIAHGVRIAEEARYTGEIRRGLVLADNLEGAGRAGGIDVFEHLQGSVPLDLVGRESELLDGLGEIESSQVPAVACHYRFLFHPARYASLDQSVCEAMAAGLPLVALSTSEVGSVIRDGVSGYTGADLGRLAERMRELLEHPQEARRLGEGARQYARERFALDRFVNEWNETFSQAAARGRGPAAQAPGPATLSSRPSSGRNA